MSALAKQIARHTWNSHAQLVWKGIKLVIYFDWDKGYEPMGWKPCVNGVEFIVPCDDEWNEGSDCILDSLKEKDVNDICAMIERGEVRK